MHRSRPITTALVLVAIATSGSACASEGASPEERADPVRGTQVSVVDNDFEPAALEVAAGETVTWRWEGSADHNVVGEGFESEVQRDGDFSHTFTEVGEHDYRCTLHPSMTGTILVGET